MRGRCEWPYRTARKLGAGPLAAEATGEVAALGESVAERLGTRAAAHADGPGLIRRELEVVRLVGVGRTNRLTPAHGWRRHTALPSSIC